MKFMLLFVIFIVISEARPNERIEETIKSRWTQLGSFKEDVKKIVRNFNTKIEDNAVHLNKEILGINEDRRIQADRLNEGIEIEKSDNASIAKNNGDRLIERIRKNIDLIPTKLYILNDNSEERVKSFTTKMENDVALLNNEIKKSVEQRFSRGKSLSQDIDSKVTSFIAKKKDFVEGTKGKIHGQVDHCREQAGRRIEFIKDRMNYYIVMSQAAVKILDKRIKVAENRPRFEWENIEEDIKRALDDFNENIQKYIEELIGEIRDFVNDLVDGGKCFCDDIHDDVRKLKENIWDNVEILNEKLQTAVFDPINGAIAKEFGISEETRKPPVNAGTSVININRGMKTFICNGGFSIINSQVKCGTQPSYYREIEDRVVDRILYHSEEYFKPTTNTMEGFKYTLDLNDPNAILQIQATRKNTIDGFKYSLDLVDPNATPLFFETSRAGSSNICFFLLYIILTVIFYV